MATATRVDDIVAATILELSQVPGVATQIYSADRIRMFIQDAFQLEFDDFAWPQYKDWVTAAPDGTTGRLANDLIGGLGAIKSYEDIETVFRADTNRKVVALPQGVNPFGLTGGGLTLYMSPDGVIPNRPFRIWPQDSTQSVVVYGLQMPTLPFSGDDTVLIDDLLLKYDACWMYCVDDGTVPAQVAKFQQLAQKRRTMMQAAFSNQPLPLDPRISINDLIDDASRVNNTFVLNSSVLG